MNNLGNAYGSCGGLRRPSAASSRTLAICREIGDRHGEGRTLDNLGTAYAGLRRFEEAIGCYQQSLAIRQEIGDRHGEGQTLDNLGITYQNMRQRDRATMCWREAAAALRDVGEHEEAGRLESWPRALRPGGAAGGALTGADERDSRTGGCQTAIWRRTVT